ncbi:hypothetical protein AKJ51_00300 [candidate division MSBL1 archaeon SCGC-AAA382A20]|uniref:Uncharacterized protein n=1 Tax=candidate division MSBL1 archaeon SCGC-AAA382A20 TaxID=1698280 RepID=A0A133VMS1_9EURY|nr:hypothetical protein AKJ51_00300 [candidate division MSBL1 archaeon SCGC-AAA382A20]
MTVEIGDFKDAEKWLTSDEWLVFTFQGDFCQFLEYTFFPPGTEKNAEFEVMMLPEEGGLSLWFRIKDTKENRENLKKALSQFYGPVKDSIDEEIEKLQKNAKQFAEKLSKGGDL